MVRDQQILYLCQGLDSGTLGVPSSSVDLNEDLQDLGRVGVEEHQNEPFSAPSSPVMRQKVLEVTSWTCAAEGLGSARCWATSQNVGLYDEDCWHLSVREGSFWPVTSWCSLAIKLAAQSRAGAHVVQTQLRPSTCISFYKLRVPFCTYK